MTAIDISEGMLARLDAKVRKFGVPKLDAHAMDGRQLEFKRDYFHWNIGLRPLYYSPD